MWKQVNLVMQSCLHLLARDKGPAGQRCLCRKSQEVCGKTQRTAPQSEMHGRACENQIIGAFWGTQTWANMRWHWICSDINATLSITRSSPLSRISPRLSAWEATQQRPPPREKLSDWLIMPRIGSCWLACQYPAPKLAKRFKPTRG